MQIPTTRQLYLAFDEAYQNSGWAILSWDIQNGKPTYVDSGVWHPSLKMGMKGDSIAFLEHMAFIKRKIEEVRTLGDLKAIAIEGIAYGAPGQATARGGIFSLYATTPVQYADLVIIGPKKMKAYITGSGSAEKEEIEHIVCEKYGVKREFKTKKAHEMFLNETDAIALAEIGLYAWRVHTYGIEIIKKEMEPHQAKILWSTDIIKPATKTREAKHHGICNRLDDFYIPKKGKD